MSRLRAWLVAGVTLVLSTAALVFSVASGAELIGVSVAALLLTAVGAFLVIRVPHNTVGPVLAIGGAAWLLYIAAGEYARLSLLSGPLPGEHVAAWLGSWIGALLPASLAALMLLFPDGRPPRGWSWVGLVLALVVASALLGAVLLWGLPVTVLADLAALDMQSSYVWVNLAFIGGFVSTVPASLSLVSRYQRGNAVMRQQVKWLAASAVLLATVVVMGVLFDSSVLWEVALSATVALIPVAVALAVLRYRLYDIDRIISRTVSYTLVLALLGSVALGLVSVLALFLPSDDPLVVATSTLVVFALFIPMRRRVQGVVDRRFHRSRFDAARVIDDFTGSLRDRVDAGGVIADWVAVVEKTMQPAAVGVWMRQ